MPGPSLDASFSASASSQRRAARAVIGRLYSKAPVRAKRRSRVIRSTRLVERTIGKRGQQQTLAVVGRGDDTEVAGVCHPVSDSAGPPGNLLRASFAGALGQAPFPT